MKLILSYNISGNDNNNNNNARHAITGAMISIAVCFDIEVKFTSEDQTDGLTFTYDDKSISLHLEKVIEESLERLEKKFKVQVKTFDIHYSN